MEKPQKIKILEVIWIVCREKPKNQPTNQQTAQAKPYITPFKNLNFKTVVTHSHALFAVD